MPEILVKTHVSRDLLQMAGLFSDPPKAIWEYVANGLEYVDLATSPLVCVEVNYSPKRIVITDNGRGMDLDGLQNYFIMHGENQDRKQGRNVRGRYGTGKSAAFGIARQLTVTTVRHGERSKVQLSRADIESQTTGAEIPIRVLEAGVHSTDPNGTQIEIDGLAGFVTVEKIVQYFERQLAHWKKNGKVFVNGKECVVPEPPVDFERTFQPDEDQHTTLGDVLLTVKVSKEWLEDHRRGIAIYSDGILHETRPVDRCAYIFGEIEVPALEDDQSAIHPFDVSRSLRLNPNNSIVSVLFGFIDKCAKEVRDELEKRKKEEQGTQEAERLRKQADEIARFLNEDFNSVRERLPTTRPARNPGGVIEKTPQTGDDKGGTLLPGGDIPARPIPSPPKLGPKGFPQPGDPTGPSQGQKPTDLEASKDDEPRAGVGETGGFGLQHVDGFRVEYENHGEQANRSKYASEQKTIFINLDHPQVKAALRSGPVESQQFKRFTFELAANEYAMAIVMELGQEPGNFSDFIAPIEEVRDTIERLSRMGVRFWTS